MSHRDGVADYVSINTIPQLGKTGKTNKCHHKHVHTASIHPSDHKHFEELPQLQWMADPSIMFSNLCDVFHQWLAGKHFHICEYFPQLKGGCCCILGNQFHQFSGSGFQLARIRTHLEVDARPKPLLLIPHNVGHLFFFFSEIQELDDALVKIKCYPGQLPQQTNETDWGFPINSQSWEESAISIGSNKFVRS